MGLGKRSLGWGKQNPVLVGQAEVDGRLQEAQWCCLCLVLF